MKWRRDRSIDGYHGDRRGFELTIWRQDKDWGFLATKNGQYMSISGDAGTLESAKERVIRLVDAVADALKKGVE